MTGVKVLQWACIIITTLLYRRICGVIMHNLELLLEARLPTGATLTQQTKTRWLHLCHCCYRLSPIQGHHPCQSHWRCRQRWLGSGTLQQKMAQLQCQPPSPRAPPLLLHRSHWEWWPCCHRAALGSRGWGHQKPSGELLIPRDISDEISLIRRRRKIHHFSLHGGSPLLPHRWAGAAWGDLQRGLQRRRWSRECWQWSFSTVWWWTPLFGGERACLVPLLSSIDCERRGKKVNPR
jgi:hypothetical protein